MSNRRTTPPLESGVARTEQITNIHVPEEPTPLHAPESPQDGHSAPEGVEVVSEPGSPPQPQYTARLTADEANEVRRRMAAVDYLMAEAKSRQESIEMQAKDLAHIRQGHAAAQRDLTGFVQSLIRQYGLAPGVTYRADPDQAALVPVGPAQQ